MDASRSSEISSNDLAFPRGGATALTPLEVKQISNEATSDALFETSKGNKRSAEPSSERKKKKAKSSSKSKSSHEQSSEAEDSVEIENFNFKSIIPGSLVLGKITRIGKLELTLSVGDNLVGFIPITSISEEVNKKLDQIDNDSEPEVEEDDDGNVTTATLNNSRREMPLLSNIFTTGQWLRAKTVKPEGSNKRIQFTIEPNIINEDIELEDYSSGNMLQCSVASIEDRGLVMNTGKDSVSGFISLENLKKANASVEDFHVGQVLLTSIVSKPKSRVVQLKVGVNAKSTINSVSSIDAIKPGILADALVTKISRNGLVAKVFGLVDGTINLSQLHDFDLQSLKHRFTIGNSFKARVIGVLPKGGTKKLILSHLPHVLALSNIQNSIESLSSFPIGHVFESVRIQGSDPNYFFVSFGKSDLFGRVHRSRIDPSKSVDVDYSTGSKHKARSMGFDEIDNLLILSLSPRDIEAKYLAVGDIPDGEYIDKCEILKVLPDGNGMVVKIFDEFEAIVPGSHMSDVRLIYPERKFRVGSNVRGRLLKKENRKALVTLKKTLVNMEDSEVLSNFEEARTDFKSLGTVEKYVPGGALISFFGNLRAFLPKNEISEAFVSNATDYLKLGQTVNVRIINIKENEKRVVVSLKQLKNNKISTGSELQNGKTVVKGTVVEKLKDRVILNLEQSSLRGVLYDGHLSDGNYEQTRHLLKKISVGEDIEVLVLEKDVKSGAVIVTAKESMKDAAKNGGVPSSFKEIKVSNVTLKGFIKSVTNLGLFVSFAGKLTGLVLAKYATNKKNESLSDKFYQYQSVSCRVIRVDENSKRFLLSFKTQTGDESNMELVVNPVDASMKRIGDYTPGVVTKAIVKSVKGTQLNIQLADNLQGRIDITQCFDSWDDIKNKKQPLSQFHRGDQVTAKVLGLHDAKNHKFLPITHRFNNKSHILELSMLKKETKTPGDVSELLTLQNIQKKTKWVVYVNNISQNVVWVSLTSTVKGRIPLMELSDDGSIFDDFSNKVFVGMALKADVKEIDLEHNVIELSARQSNVTSIEDLKINHAYPSRIMKIKESYVLVELGKNIVASSFITDALNDYSTKLDDVFHSNEYTTSTILSIDKETKKVSVSLHNKNATDRLINSVSDLHRGDVLRGFVKNVSNNGVYVALGRSVHALVRVSDLSDSYLKEWKKYFKPYQNVLGKITSCKEAGRILMTLKSSEVNGEVEVLRKFNDIEVGDIYEGSVRGVTDFGVFVKLDNTMNVSGLCHHSELADVDVESPAKLFGDGDRVKVKILDKNDEKKQLSLGMKASYFLSGEDVIMEDAAQGVQEHELQDSTSSNSEDEYEEESGSEEMDVIKDVASRGVAEMDSGSEENDGSDEDSGDEIVEKPHEEFSSGLKTNGFDWTASILDQAEESSDSDDDSEQETRKKKKKRTIVRDKTAELSVGAPESIADFERLLVSNPNSSILWMNYMSFQIKLGETEKAREIGERALKTIAYRDEQEKLNIWIALLNLENSFGTDETLEELFTLACQYMDSFTIHQKLVNIFIMSERFDKANDLYMTMIKKFSDETSVWVQYASYLMDREQHDEVQNILLKGMQALPKKYHVDLVKKFAQLEFSKGSAEQGRSLIEGLVADLPKRIDLWNVYIDQEIKYGSKDKVEDLFERAIQKKLSRKQAKFFFNKWLSYEDMNGDSEGSVKVKSKAAQYVEALERQKS